MVQVKKTYICKICKASFVPLFKKEKDSSICYVCDSISNVEPKDCVYDLDTTSPEYNIIFNKKKTPKKSKKKIIKKVKLKGKTVKGGIKTKHGK